MTNRPTTRAAAQLLGAGAPVDRDISNALLDGITMASAHGATGVQGQLDATVQAIANDAGTMLAADPADWSIRQGLHAVHCMTRLNGEFPRYCEETPDWLLAYELRPNAAALLWMTITDAILSNRPLPTAAPTQRPERLDLARIEEENELAGLLRGPDVWASSPNELLFPGGGMEITRKQWRTAIRVWTKGETPRELALPDPVFSTFAASIGTMFAARLLPGGEEVAQIVAGRLADVVEGTCKHDAAIPALVATFGGTADQQAASVNRPLATLLGLVEHHALGPVLPEDAPLELYTPVIASGSDDELMLVGVVIGPENKDGTVPVHDDHVHIDGEWTNVAHARLMRRQPLRLVVRLQPTA